MDRDLDPPPNPETREEYIERYIRHFHVCILAIALGTLVGYFANSLELLEQHEYQLAQQLQYVRYVRRQQSHTHSALSSISRDLTVWAGVDTGVIASLGATDSLGNAWSDADGNIYPAVDGTMEPQERLSVSAVCSWEGELDEPAHSPPGSPTEGHNGGSEDDGTMAEGEGSEDGGSAGDHDEGVDGGRDWIPWDAEEDEVSYDADAHTAPPWAEPREHQDEGPTG